MEVFQEGKLEKFHSVGSAQTSSILDDSVQQTLVIILKNDIYYVSENTVIDK